MGMSFDLILYKVFFNQFILLYGKLYTEGMLLSCTIPTLSPITILETDMQLDGPNSWTYQLSHALYNSEYVTPNPPEISTVFQI